MTNNCRVILITVEDGNACTAALSTTDIGLVVCVARNMKKTNRLFTWPRFNQQCDIGVSFHDKIFNKKKVVGNTPEDCKYHT